MVAGGKDGKSGPYAGKLGISPENILLLYA